MINKDIKMREMQTNELLNTLFYQNKLDSSILAKDAIWCVNNQILRHDRGEIQYHLDHTAIGSEIKELHVSYADSSHIGEECISITGNVSYNDMRDDSLRVTVTFMVIWQLIDDEWEIKKIFTCREREEADNRDQNDNTSSAMNDAELLQNFPTGLICCSDVDSLPIRRMNDKVFELMGYKSVNEYTYSSGNCLMNSVHPDDVQGLREYIKAIREDRNEDNIRIRLRKKDYNYTVVQMFGERLKNTWLIFACVDYTEQQDRIENLEIESNRLADLREGYRTLISNLPTGFYNSILCEKVCVKYMSDRFCDMIGYTKDELDQKTGSNYMELIVPEDRSRVMRAISSLVQYPHTEQMTYHITKKDGEVIRVLDRMRSARRSDGKMWGYSVVVDLHEGSAFASRMVNKEPVEEMHHESISRTAAGHSVYIRTFGYFEVIMDGKPIAFRSTKARELLALLVDRRGNFVTRESIVNALWENETVNTTTLARTRRTYLNLTEELRSYGIEDIVETQNGQRRIVKEKITCDLYDYENGIAGAEKLFKGEYMNDFSWAENTLSALLPTYY